jgi:ferredoxin
MSYVIQEACVKCKYGDCVEVCPVNCFFEAEEQLFINPEECIDCDACRETCPVDAIVPEDEAEAAWVTKAADFDYSDESKRCESKEDVVHGPKWDADKA